MVGVHLYRSMRLPRDFLFVIDPHAARCRKANVTTAMTHMQHSCSMVTQPSPTNSSAAASCAPSFPQETSGKTDRPGKRHGSPESRSGGDRLLVGLGRVVSCRPLLSFHDAKGNKGENG